LLKQSLSTFNNSSVWNPIRALAFKKQKIYFKKYLNKKEVAYLFNELALLYYNQGKYEEAEPLYKKALKIFENILGKNHPNTNIVKESLKVFLQKK
jgi:tetratricopeptide (TPR) repeat protein